MFDGDNEEPLFCVDTEELLARGDFAKFPPLDSRSLTCSRLVDENNLLKPLPKVLIEGTVSANGVLDLASVSEGEGVNFETSEVNPPPPTFCKAVHQPKPRKSREQRIVRVGRKVSRQTWSVVKVKITQLSIMCDLCQVVNQVTVKSSFKSLKCPG